MRPPTRRSIEYEQKFGPVVMARAALDDAGRAALHEDLLRFFREASTTDAAGNAVFGPEYLVITGAKAAG